MERLDLAFPGSRPPAAEPTAPPPYNPWGSEGSPEHRMLRDYIALNPDSISASEFGSTGSTEYPLKSGDSIDVRFENEGSILAVEVKSRRSSNDDIQRGIFQCVKYSAVLEAEQRLEKSPKDVSALLVLERTLNRENKRIANKLVVPWIDGFEVPVPTT